MMRLANGKVALALVIFAALGVLAGNTFTATGEGFGHPQTGEFEVGVFHEPKTCGMCHPLQLEQYLGSMHNLAATDPFYHRVVLMAEEELPGIGDFCSSCHTPGAVLTGQDPLDLENLDPAAQSGVFCDFCHTVSEATHMGNFGFKSSPGKLKYGPYGWEPPIFHTVQESPLHDSAQFCGTCHDVSHPVNDLPLETTYSEFMEGPYPELGFKCQSCHMTPGITEFEQNPAPFANGMPEREHFWTHTFVGGNAFITEMMGSEVHAEMARERLSRAAEVTINSPSTDPNSGKFSFNVVVENVGAGHKIPTGVTEERQIWLEVTVLGADGSELAHFGAMDSHGEIASDTMILGTTFGDAEGNPTHKIWFAESVLWDRRIGPKASDMESYSVALEAGQTVGKIQATLWYRSSHQDFVDIAFADSEERVIVPNILMNEVVWEK